MTSQQKKIGKEQLVHHVPGKDIDRLDWLSLYKTPSSDVFEDKLEAWVPYGLSLIQQTNGLFEL